MITNRMTSVNAARIGRQYQCRKSDVRSERPFADGEATVAIERDAADEVPRRDRERDCHTEHEDS